jgi:hypothetical protein
VKVALADGGCESWLIAAARRFRTDTLLKTVGTCLFMVLFFVGYFYLLKNPRVPPLVMPLTAIDRMMPFVPLALPIYVSLWVYVSLPPSLFETRREAISYALVTAGMCGAGLLCFLVWPTAVPPAPIDWMHYPGYASLKGVDAAGNACPSLHVASAVFSGIWLDRQLRHFGAGPIGRWSNAAWCAAIVLSTLATRQHVALDAAGGLTLGLACAYLPRSWVSSRV